MTSDLTARSSAIVCVCVFFFLEETRLRKVEKEWHHWWGWDWSFYWICAGLSEYCRIHLIPVTRIEIKEGHALLLILKRLVGQHHHRQSLNREARWGTTDDLATSFFHFPLFSTAFWDLLNSRPVHSLMLSSHLFLCLPCLLPPVTVPCKMVLARPDERETWPYRCSLRLFTIVWWARPDGSALFILRT